MNPSAEEREFHDPDTASSSSASHVPRQPVVIPSSREMLGRDSGLLTTTRETMSSSGSVSGNQQLEKNLPQLSLKIRGSKLLRIVEWDRPKRPWDQ